MLCSYLSTLRPGKLIKYIGICLPKPELHQHQLLAMQDVYDRAMHQDIAAASRLRAGTKPAGQHIRKAAAVSAVQPALLICGVLVG